MSEFEAVGLVWLLCSAGWHMIGNVKRGDLRDDIERLERELRKTRRDAGLLPDPGRRTR